MGYTRPTRRRLTTALVCLALVAALVPIVTSSSANALPVGFTLADIASDVDGARSVAAADLDGDGDLDLASASAADDTIAWHENEGNGASWTSTNVAADADGARSVAAADLDGDGDLDLASASFEDDTIAWYENTAGDGSAWTATNIITVADGASSVAAGDVDGDGDQDIVAASATSDRVAWFENTAGDATLWGPGVISTTADGATSVTTGDVDGDGDLDVLSASAENDTIAWYANTAGDGSAWTPDAIAVDVDGASAVATGDLDGDGDLDVASAGALDDTIAWYANTAGDGSAWSPGTISTTADGAAAVAVADLDADGDLDLASASTNDDTIAWYENTAGDASAWSEQDVTTAVDGASSVALADLDRDGDLDLATAGSENDTVAWHTNDLPVRTGPSWNPATIDSGLQIDPSHTALVDIEGDGDLDVVAAESFYDDVILMENQSGDGSTWATSTLFQTDDRPIRITPADVDSDGDADLVVGHFGGENLIWYENTGNMASWPDTEIHAATTSIGQVAAGDIDGDGDVDLASTESTEGDVVVHLNTNGDGSAWGLVDIDTGRPVVSGVAIADLDGDGDLDLVTSSGTYDRISWHENVNGDASTWTTAIISQTVNGPEDLVTEDLDGDGDIDLASTNYEDDSLAWYENSNGDASTWTATVIATDLELADAARAGDIDGDGDLDLSATDPSNGEIMWYQNASGDATTWEARVIALEADGAHSTGLGDIDRDGDLDIVSGNSINTGPSVVWYEAMPTLSAAEASVTEGDTLPVEVTAGRVHDEVTVDLSTVDDTATEFDDYTPLTDVAVSIAPPETSDTVNVTTIDDDIDEPDEVLTVALTDPVGAGASDGAALTILDDDPTPELSIDNVTVTEKNSTNVNAEFTIELTNPSSEAVELQVKTSKDSAKKDEDYVHKDKQVTIDPGETSETFTVKVEGDKIDEDKEKFFVDLSSPVNAVLGDDRGKGTIEDNDDKSKLSITNVSKKEGDSGKKSFTFKVTLNRESGKTIEVDYDTKKDSAKSPSDYVGKDGTLTFKPGVTKKEITIKVKGDKKDEGKEKFKVKLSKVKSGTIDDGTGKGTIKNDD